MVFSKAVRGIAQRTTSLTLPRKVTAFCNAVHAARSVNQFDIVSQAAALRRLVRSAAWLPESVPVMLDAEELWIEFDFTHANANLLRPAFQALQSQRVLFAGQAYYNTWYLSRALRPLGWTADVYNWDINPASQIYYHGEDFRLGGDISLSLGGELAFYLSSLYAYDVFHFSNSRGVAFGPNLQVAVATRIGQHGEIHLLKALGKKLTYANNGCLDGVSQTAFAKWGPDSVCSICRWQNEPSVCSDARNLEWGAFRNAVADYQCLLGGNRADYNNDPRVHEVPEFYCLDPELWRPDIKIPDSYRLPAAADGGVRVYHAVGHKESRTSEEGINIKSSHVWLPLIDRLRADGLALDLIAPTDVPNKEVRFLQAQADIFLEMLSYGWFGANAREAMMLGKPVICFIRPEWLESLRKEIPEYADELPIVSATPQTAEAVLRDLIAHPEKRREIGRRGREFALKWHSAEAGGRHFDRVFRGLLSGDPMLGGSR